MPRFLVFVFGDYYPEGGLNDLRFQCDSLELAKKQAFSYSNEYKQILDVQERVVHEFIDGDWKERFLV
jgi:hypothetical protein